MFKSPCSDISMKGSMEKKDVDELIGRLKNPAIENMKSQKGLMPVAIIPDPAGEKIIGIPNFDNETKPVALRAVGSMVSDGVILIVDSWVNICEKHKLKRPMDMPVDDRSQAIVISWFDLAGGGKGNRTLMIMYSSSKKIISEEYFDSGEGGLFDYLMGGYLSSHQS